MSWAVLRIEELLFSEILNAIDPRRLNDSECVLICKEIHTQVYEPRAAYTRLVYLMPLCQRGPMT